MGFTKIALVGGTGHLGQCILYHLKSPTPSNFDITILGRQDAAGENEEDQSKDEDGNNIKIK